MVQVTSREFRDNQAAMFSLADKGEQVVIQRRGKQSYMLMPVYDDDFVMSPELEARIEEGMRQYREGNTVKCSNKEELHAFLDSL